MINKLKMKQCFFKSTLFCALDKYLSIIKGDIMVKFNECKMTLTAMLFAAVTLLFGATNASAHHGAASAAFGPGAPVETTAPLTLPEGMWLIYDRYELADYKPYKGQRGGYVNGESQNIDTYTFNSLMLGYGIKNSLSGYVILPWAEKKQDDLGAASGFGDITLLLQYGFKYGVRDGIKGWYANDKDDALGKEYTLHDYKFTVFGSLSIPTGSINIRGNDLDGDGNGDTLSMGNQAGFGGPSYNFGIAASTLIIDHLTFTADAQIRTFDQTNDFKPGNEMRLNAALGYEIFEKKGGFLSRVDIIGEANFLNLDRDQDGNRVATSGTGGSILYLSPGMRLTFQDKFSLGMLIKLPTWTNLNRESDQQGAEGLERFRAIVSASLSF